MTFSLVAAGVADVVERLAARRRRRGSFLNCGEAVDLHLFDGVGDLQDVDGAVLVAVGVRVDADDDAVARLAFLGRSGSSPRRSAAEVAAVDAGDHAAHVVDPVGR
jgi:hypothetical protein